MAGILQSRPNMRGERSMDISSAAPRSSSRPTSSPLFHPFLLLLLLVGSEIATSAAFPRSSGRNIAETNEHDELQEMKSSDFFLELMRAWMAARDAEEAKGRGAREEFRVPEAKRGEEKASTKHRKRDDSELVTMEELAVLCKHNPVTCFGRRRRRSADPRTHGSSGQSRDFLDQEHDANQEAQ